MMCVSVCKEMLLWTCGICAYVLMNHFSIIVMSSRHPGMFSVLSSMYIKKEQDTRTLNPLLHHLNVLLTS
jgi:hypothetical protein